MEPPFKKQRVEGSSYSEIDLHARRAQNDFRLKSIFESIFEKYGRDFDGIGDEIDLKTGEIVVDNGHILGMANERDAGDAKYTPEEPSHFDADDDDDDDHPSIDFSEANPEGLELFNAGDAAVIEESEASDQSAFDADSLMGDVPADFHLHQLGERSREAIPMPMDDEEDELASSDIEWASHSKDRLSAQERWCLRKDRDSGKDEPAVEPAWRAPPLWNNTLIRRETDFLGLESVDDMRDYSDDERAGISLWAPEIKNRSRQRHESANSTNQQSLAVARGQENNADGLLSDMSDSGPPARRVVRWTQEEEDLLIYLKTATNLTCAAMESHFPGRQGNSIGSHWTHMINQGKASSKPQRPMTLGRRIALPSLSSSLSSLALDETNPKPHDQDSLLRATKSQAVRQQPNGEFPEAESLVRSLSEHIENLGDPHTDYQYRAGGDHVSLNDYAMDGSRLIYDNVGVHIEYTLGEPFSSVSDRETKGITVHDSLDDASEPPARTSDNSHPIEKTRNRSGRRSIYRHRMRTRKLKHSDQSQVSVSRTYDLADQLDDSHKKAESSDQANSNNSHTDSDQADRLSKPLESEDQVGWKGASSFLEREFGFVAKNDGGARTSSPIAPIKAAHDLNGAESYANGVDSLEIQFRCSIAVEASSPSEFQREEPVPPAADDNNQRSRLMEAKPQNTDSTNEVWTNSEQPPEHGGSSAFHEPDLELTSEDLVKRQIVQVVIPLTAASNMASKCGGTEKIQLSHPLVGSPSETTETQDPVFIRQDFATAESAPEALGSDLLPQEDLVIHTPTRSPSLAAAESQYATSAAFGKEVRSSLGAEIADSQPLSTTPVIATPVQELGSEATRPIILDAEPQRLRTSPGVRLSLRKEPKRATKTIILDSSSQPTLGIATPAPRRIEDVTESDIVESGSAPPSRKFLASRSLSKKAKKEIVADSSSIWTTIDDYSEDELSYL